MKDLEQIEGYLEMLQYELRVDTLAADGLYDEYGDSIYDYPEVSEKYIELKQAIRKMTIEAQEIEGALEVIKRTEDKLNTTPEKFDCEL